MALRWQNGRFVVVQAQRSETEEESNIRLNVAIGEERVSGASQLGKEPVGLVGLARADPLPPGLPSRTT